MQREGEGLMLTLSGEGVHDLLLDTFLAFRKTLVLWRGKTNRGRCEPIALEGDERPVVTSDCREVRCERRRRERTRR
jgi:hypothetical protein